MLQVDFHEVADDEKVTVLVPVETTGEAVGVKTGGGVLEHVMFRVRVRALPKDLPEVITVDVSHLDIGQAIHIGDIKPPPGTEILGDKSISVIAVAAPRAEEEVAPEAVAETAAAGDVEMIKEKKGEEGEEAPAKGAEKVEKGAEKGAAKAAEKAAPKPGEKTPEKAAEKPGEKKAEKAAEKRK
jgi:large subunit ribosomal protein L25